MKDKKFKDDKGIDKMEKNEMGMKMRGIVYDKIENVTDKPITFIRGNEEVTIKPFSTLEMPVQENTVVNSFKKIMGALIKGEEDFFNNLWWEVGSGSSDWDDNNLPSPSKDDTKLLKPLYRKKIAPESIKYVDTKGETSSEITNKVAMGVTFEAGEANGHLREFSIYIGGDSNLSSGLPINRKIHGTIFKTEGIKLTRRIEFTFDLA